ncbi:MAG: sigma-70 family RNA polymerase sigma factor [Clostridia bacterium]|nr:sigma-70 family RNA polymerase sigma factor [Clostridia bacterium]
MKNNPGKPDTDDLIRAVKAGDGEAFELLASGYRGMIKAQVSSFRSSVFSRDDGAGFAFSEEDLRQEAEIAFLRAARTYDPETKKGVTFGLYAKICVKNALISLYRKKMAQKRRQRRAGVGKDVDGTADRSAPAVDLESLRTRAERILSPFESAVFGAYVRGLKPAEAAEELGVPEKSVYNALYRAKHKIRRLPEE